MKLQDTNHLSEEQILWATIDASELQEENRLHLSQCRLCRKRIEILQDELHGFGENVARSVPPLTKKIKLPREEPEMVGKRASWLPSFGVAAMACLALFFYFLGTESNIPKHTAILSPGAVFEDEYLMEDIFEIVENPFSETMYEITGDNGSFDDEFLEYVVPDIQEDFQSKNYIQGGVKQC
ncbi:MAG: hypothetical protein JRF02_04790 [Deltaproteobacteria bacterium]|jgi:hypothetical protein|nr:hypothetical protein [Deltaproteobacteria bacterium]